MEESQDSLNQENSNASEIMQSLGVSPDASEDSMNESKEKSLAKDSDPLNVKKRLGMQAKKHQRELRAMQEQIMQLHSRIGDPKESESQESMNTYMQNSANQPGLSVEEQVQRGVRYALQAKDAEERKAKEAIQKEHVRKQYKRLHDEFEKASEKYEDFDDVVRGDDVPFSPVIRDALLFVDNAADVAYKLGKNREELNRISQLHPLDQTREVNKLSFALMGGNSRASSAPSSTGSRPMGDIKVNPANNSQVTTDKTPISVLRARMKAGAWK